MIVDEDLRQLQVNTQRAVAAAHQLDARLESPATARLIAAARALLQEVASVVDAQRPVPLAAAPIAPASPPLPAKPEPKVGDIVEYEVANNFWRRGKVTMVYDSELLKERMLWVEWKYGSAEVAASEVRRP